MLYARYFLAHDKRRPSWNSCFRLSTQCYHSSIFYHIAPHRVAIHQGGWQSISG